MGRNLARMAFKALYWFCSNLFKLTLLHLCIVNYLVLKNINTH